MRVVVQRVRWGRVLCDEREVAAIGPGLLLLVGIAADDVEERALWMAEKIVGLRLFSDDQGRMNLALDDVGGAILAVSQFTLLGDASKGRRPSFVAAAHPQLAAPLFERFVSTLRERVACVETGRFGANMRVELCNDGPVTLVIDR